jgi:23S rRNA (guanosine2251-2'-O)-methyltransferase
MMKRTCVLILDNIRSVENTASIFRTAECLGVAKLYLIGTTPTPLDRFGRKRPDFAKVALGAEDLVDWEYAKEAKETIEELKSQNFEIIALEQDLRAKDLKTFKLPNDTFALIVGNEVDGVQRFNLDMTDAIVEIKMRGEKESLNVSVATGIALYTLLANQ